MSIADTERGDGFVRTLPELHSSSSAEALTSPGPDAVLAEVRTRFVADFPIRCDAAAALIASTADAATRKDAAQSLRTLAHNIAGLAGVIGFPQVGTLASELESLTGELADGSADLRAAHTVVDSMRMAFVHEVVQTFAAGTGAASVVHRGDVLVVEDDDDQRAVVMNQLSVAGYRTHAVTSGTAVCRVARALTPSVILLDVELPGSDGYSVCRQLKADPELATIPVLFMTARARLDDRLAGLILGADDYLVKPVDPRELVIRLDRVRARNAARAEQASVGGVLAYNDFLQVARTRLVCSPVAFVLMRVPAHQVDHAVATVRQEIRRADVVAPYDRTHLALLLPELTGAAACSRMNGLINRLIEWGINDVRAGIACAESAGAATVEALMAGAEDALMQARYCGKTVALHGDSIAPASRPGGASVLAADDDPDVVRILDAALRGAGHHTTLAFDGLEALTSIEHGRPDVLILDLMMPKLGGFDLLNRLQQLDGPRPKVIVLSARGREEDVVRAFDLGADDYVTKPFNPRELLARVARLLR